jgi:hypothetical protein
MSAGLLVAVAGAARSASAVDVPASSIYLWNSGDYGAGAGNVPGHPTWAWDNNPGFSMTFQPVIDSTGRIYVQAAFDGSDPNMFINYGIFHATNSTNISLYQSWIGGAADPSTGLALTNNDGTAAGINSYSTLRVSDTAVGLGVRIGSATPGLINEFTSGADLQNNQVLYSGSLASQASVGRMGNVISLPNTNDWTATPTGTVSANNLFSFRDIGQFGDMNRAGTWVIGGALATDGPNAATPSTQDPDTFQTITTGNASVLGTFSASGAFTSIARAGDLPLGPGGPQFVSSGYDNGVGGYLSKINQNGQVAFDAKFLDASAGGGPGPGGVTSSVSHTAWIYTPGAGTQASKMTQVYQEGLNTPTTATSNGTATFTSGVFTGNRAFANAGMLYIATSSGGDTVLAGGNTDNSNFCLISSSAPGHNVALGGVPTVVFRQNDVAPGYTPAQNVRMGVVNAYSMCINNAGQVALPVSLQGSGVTASTSPIYTDNGDWFNPIITGVDTPGVVGNDTALVIGTPGNLRTLIRSGDAAPGFAGFYYNYSPSMPAAAIMNNAGDVLFSSDLISLPAGSTYANWPGYTSASTIQGAVFGYSASLDQVVNLLYPGQSIEVAPGIFKYIVTININSAGDGNGSALGLNDNGQFVAMVQTAETWTGPYSTSPTGTAYVVLNIPTPGGAAMLGLAGLLAARRRRSRA